MIQTRHFLILYWVVVVLMIVLLAWWVFFFYRQGEFLVTETREAGQPLSPAQEVVVRDATRATTRMFLFEGAFLGLLLLASVYLILRSLHREVLLHRQQKNFLSAVTHELRSPIASARLYVESLLLDRVQPEKQKRYLENARDDLDRLTERVDDLLESARMTNALPQLNIERVDLADHCSSLLDRLADKKDFSGARLELDAPKPVLVQADRGALDTILGNLVSNAVKYGGDAPRVDVRVRDDGRRAMLEVIDSGPGLQGADGRRIFEPFIRGDAPRIEARPGVGLGLYLVRELTRALGGEVRAQDHPEGGTLVMVSLPLLAEEA